MTGIAYKTDDCLEVTGTYVRLKILAIEPFDKIVDLILIGSAFD